MNWAQKVNILSAGSRWLIGLNIYLINCILAVVLAGLTHPGEGAQESTQKLAVAGLMQKSIWSRLVLTDRCVLCLVLVQKTIHWYLMCVCPSNRKHLLVWVSLGGRSLLFRTSERVSSRGYLRSKLWKGKNNVGVFLFCLYSTKRLLFTLNFVVICDFV